MPYYMLQAAYTPEAWAGMVKHPQDRLDAVRPVIEKLGGTIERRWLASGEYDIVLVCQLPSNVSEEAFSMAASAGGAVNGQDHARDGHRRGDERQCGEPAGSATGPLRLAEQHARESPFPNPMTEAAANET